MGDKLGKPKFGTHQGETVREGSYKFSATRGADRIIKRKEKVYVIAECEGDWAKYAPNPHGDLEVTYSLKVLTFIESPEELVPTLRAAINEWVEAQSEAPLFDEPDSEVPA